MRKSDSQASLLIVLLLAAAFYAAFIARTSFRVDGQAFFTLLDDAMISMRYAQHLADGNGLVWNVGEAPIEGFTNPGWVLLMALLHAVRIPQNSISLAVILVSAGILLANVVVVHRICLTLLPQGRLAPILGATIAAFYFPLVFWSLRGMELGLLVLLINLAVLAALRFPAGSASAGAGLGLLLAAAVLVRLDAALQCAAILAYVIICKENRRQALLATSVVAITLIGVLLLQDAYFGDLLPNTYYQKMTGGPIDERLKHGVLVFVQYAAWDLWFMALLVAAGLLRFRDLRTAEALLLAGLFAVQCLYSVWVGGDYAEPEAASANRFIAQGVPALIVLFALAMERGLIGPGSLQMDARLAGPAGLLIGLATVAIISGMPWARWARDNAPLLRSDIRRVRAGLAIAAFTSPDAVIAVHAAGQIPYYSRRTTIDLLGLNDPVIARGARRTGFYPGHDKWNYEYSIGQLAPDLIADNWIRLAEYMGQQSDYQKLENGMHVRRDTAMVDVKGLQEAFP